MNHRAVIGPTPRAIVLLVFCLLGGCAADTPPVKDYDPEIVALEQDQARFAEKKRALVSQAIKLEPSQQDRFWQEYGAYEEELKSYYDDKYRLVRDYARNYEQMTDAIAESLAERWFRLQQRRLDLAHKYFGRMRSSLSATIAVRFLQVENRINLLTDLKMSNETPLIGLPEEEPEDGDNDLH